MNETEDLVLITGLYPRTTGLPMVVWVGRAARRADQGDAGARHRVDAGNLAVVALRPRPHVVAGHLTAGDCTWPANGSR